MNIFKVLCSGDGTLKEPNVSAFLGYLLNPKADHGLNAEFLKSFLEPLLEEGNEKGWKISKELFNDDDEVKDLSVLSPYEIEVYYEKAFKQQQNNIVDIVIKISKKPAGKQDARLIFNSNSAIALILVENKIRKNAIREKQLIEQYNATKNTLKELNINANNNDLTTFDNECYMIFVTTKDSNFRQEWEQFIQDGGRGIHIIWNDDNDSVINKKEEKIPGDSSGSIRTVDKMITDLIKFENECQIEPLQQYAKHTLKAFLNFIWSDFKSEVDEVTKKGKRTLDYGVHGQPIKSVPLEFNDTKLFLKLFQGGKVRLHDTEGNDYKIKDDRKSDFITIINEAKITNINTSRNRSTNTIGMDLIRALERKNNNF